MTAETPCAREGCGQTITLHRDSPAGNLYCWDMESFWTEMRAAFNEGRSVLKRSTDAYLVAPAVSGAPTRETPEEIVARVNRDFTVQPEAEARTEASWSKLNAYLESRPSAETPPAPTVVNVRVTQSQLGTTPVLKCEECDYLTFDLTRLAEIHCRGGALRLTAVEGLPHGAPDVRRAVLYNPLCYAVYTWTKQEMQAEVSSLRESLAGAGRENARLKKLEAIATVERGIHGGFPEGGLLAVGQSLIDRAATIERQNNILQYIYDALDNDDYTEATLKVNEWRSSHSPTETAP